MQAAEEAQIVGLFNNFKKIFYDNTSHPLGFIRFCLYLFMNGHTQESYQKLPDTLKNDTSGNQAADIGTDIATETFLNGRNSPYKNVMAKEYLAFLNQHDKEYFTRFQKDCQQDKKFPPDKKSFDEYAASLSDYSIGRDYIRGGQKRRWQDEFKAECWKWYDEHIKNKYSKDPESVSNSTLLTLILCHLISRINLLAKPNQHIVDNLDLKITFRKNAGTPRTGFSNSELFTARSRRNYLTPEMIADTDKQKELSASAALDQINTIMLAFVGDFLNREEFYIYKRQKQLPIIRLDNTAILDSFWQDEEDVESLLLKLHNVLDAIIVSTKTDTNDKKYLEKFQKQIKTHNIYYNQSRDVFTQLYKKLTPEDFYSAREIDDTLQILGIINEYITKLPQIITELSQKDSLYKLLSTKAQNDLTSLSNQIEQQIKYHLNINREINVSFQQFALLPYQKLSDIVKLLINYCKEELPIYALLKIFINNFVTNDNILYTIDNILTLFTDYLTTDELKNIVFTLLNIKQEEFDAKLVNLCLVDTGLYALSSILKKRCANDVAPEFFEINAKNILNSDYSDQKKKEKLKQLCQPAFKMDEVEQYLKDNIIQETSPSDLKHEILKLAKSFAEQQIKKLYPISAPRTIPKQTTTPDNALNTQKRNSKLVSGQVIPELTLKHVEQGYDSSQIVAPQPINPVVSKTLEAATSSVSLSSTAKISSSQSSASTSDLTDRAQPSATAKPAMPNSKRAIFEPATTIQYPGPKSELSKSSETKELVIKGKSEKNDGLFSTLSNAVTGLFGSREKKETDDSVKSIKAQVNDTKQSNLTTNLTDNQSSKAQRPSL